MYKVLKYVFCGIFKLGSTSRPHDDVRDGSSKTNKTNFLLWRDKISYDSTILTFNICY